MIKTLVFLLALLVPTSAGCQMQTADAETTGGGISKIFVDGTTVGGSGTFALPLRSLVTVSGGWFGDGSDGVCALDGTTTVVGMTAPALASTYNVMPGSAILYIQTRDVFCTTIVVGSNVQLDTNGYRTFANTSITLNGTARISAAAFDGFDGDATNAGQAGAGMASGSVPGGAGLGGAGNIGAGGVGSSGGAPIPLGFTGNAGAGGAGVAAGGAAGVISTGFAANQGDVHVLYAAVAARTLNNINVAASLVPAGGGGGGDNGTKHGGGGGGPAGWLVVASPAITTNNTSRLDADGGKGGNGALGGGATGGGGGGHGGVAVVVIQSGTPPTITAAGGAGGLGKNGGSNGGAGAAGLILAPTGSTVWRIGA